MGLAHVGKISLFVPAAGAVFYIFTLWSIRGAICTFFFNFKNSKGNCSTPVLNVVKNV